MIGLEKMSENCRNSFLRLEEYHQVQKIHLWQGFTNLFSYEDDMRHIVGKFEVIFRQFG